MCCLIFSQRGLAYFGVLIQLLVALLIIPLITFLTAFTVGPSGDGSGRLLTLSEIAFVSSYCIGLCILALLIFRGIRCESLSTLYLSIGALLLIQLCSGVVTLLFWKPSSSPHDSHALIRVTCLLLNAISTLIYLSILVCYTAHLRTKLSHHLDQEESDFYYQQCHHHQDQT